MGEPLRMPDHYWAERTEPEVIDGLWCPATVCATCGKRFPPYMAAYQAEAHCTCKMRQQAEQWIADHPAETVTLLVEAGVLEQVAWRFEAVAPRSATEPRYGLMTYLPGEAGHHEHERVYRVSLPTKGDDTDG